MLKQRFGLFVILLLVLVSSSLVGAQDVIRGTTSGQVLNVRELPDRASTALAQFPPHTDFIVESRNEAADWLLVTAPALNLRGWIAIGFVTFEREVRVSQEIPVSTEQVNTTTMNANGAPAGGEAAPVAIIPDNIDYPAVYMPEAVWRNVRNIWARGRQLGNDPWVLMKVGESNTAGTVYLCNFEWRAYDLGTYTHLQGIVDGFSATGSFCRVNASAQNGFATVNALDPMFAPADICQPNESPLACEVRRSRASFAFIYIGLADTGILTPAEYNANLREIVRYLSDNGVVPILGTWPTADSFNANNRPQLFNEEIRDVAHALNVPLLDFRAALFNYDNHGTGPDGYHLSVRDTTRSEFGGDELTYGRTYRELQSLQILYDIMSALN
ncbi:MAG: SGNH/GDSL hydrolase family protein [Anaerolineae bacterium]|nr:SGNH/GDSL hydrolase family protein [Anaerolineae bacterium]